MATAREDLRGGELDFRPMAQADLPRVAALERESYVFPWNDQIFADCLRVGYHCVVVDTEAGVAGYGVLSMGAGEAHVLNLCISESVAAPRHRPPPAARAARACARPRDSRRLPRSAPFQPRGDRALPRAWLRVRRAAPRLLPGAGRPRGRAGLPARTRRAAAIALIALQSLRAPRDPKMNPPNDEIARRRSFAIISHPGRRQDDADREAPAVRRRDPDGGRGQGSQGGAPRDLRLDAARAAARHLGHVVRHAVPVPGPHRQPARHAGPRGFLRGHLPHADGGRLGPDGDRLRERRRGAHDQADGGLPAPRHADHDLHQQARPRRAAAGRAARRDRARTRHPVRAGHLADRHGPRVRGHLPSRRRTASTSTTAQRAAASAPIARSKASASPKRRRCSAIPRGRFARKSR